jgi:inosine kinase
MKFPGKRKSKHYFPVNRKDRPNMEFDFAARGNAYVVGVDQLLVDIEVNANLELLDEFGLVKGQSVILDDEKGQMLYRTLKTRGLVGGEFAGGAIGNTLHNYSTLSDDRSVLLGAIPAHISVGDYAFKYLCHTSTKVDLTHLQPCQGHMGKALCFICEDGERTFAISKGCMNELEQQFIPEKIVSNASALLVSAYLFSDDTRPIFKSTFEAMKSAQSNGVPIVLTLGTSGLIAGKNEFFKNLISEHVSVVAMNEEEAFALTGEEDPLLAVEQILDEVDMVLLTVGDRGLYMGGHCDRDMLRTTKGPLHTKSIVNYNNYEYSRCMEKKNCQNPVKVYSHINPYMGGPGQITNTNGAGDAALSAVLHDIASNCYHKEKVPNSPKHEIKFLTYSSISQICKYANRVSYEVLRQNSPRLRNGLPERESSLEQDYWEI